MEDRVIAEAVLALRRLEQATLPAALGGELLTLRGHERTAGHERRVTQSDVRHLREQQVVVRGVGVYGAMLPGMPRPAGGELSLIHI